MNKHWIALLGILAFAITLAVVAGSQLGSTNALAVALGVGVGVAVGIPVGLAITLSVSGKLLPRATSQEQDTTTIIMPAQQAEMLMKVLNSRQQAAPEDFPMVAAEREFTVVGGAGLDEEPLD